MESDRMMILDILHQDSEAFKATCQEARKLRALQFGERIFLYGFLYAATFCRNDCRFCQFRKSNHALPRYRRTPEEIVHGAVQLARDGVHLLDLTFGEDPYFIDGRNFGRLLDLIAMLKSQVGLPIMVSPGVLEDAQIEQLAAAGAEWFACYQENHSPSVFEQMRIGQSFSRRIHVRKHAAACGLHVEDGLLIGLGESDDDIVQSILAMKAEPLRQVRVMGYVAHSATFPQRLSSRERLNRECRIIAAMRLLMPDRLIPASLDVDGLGGLEARLDAGANVVTSIVPSDGMFSGVASDIDIAENGRSVHAVLQVLKAKGLVAATPEDRVRSLYPKGEPR